jgi:hypothetical protein
MNKEIHFLLVGVDEGDGVISHIVSITGIADYNGDIIHKGAFEASIKANGPQSKTKIIQCLWMNDWDEPIGKPLEMREISRDELPKQILSTYPNATGGLFIKTELSITTPSLLANTSRGRDAYALIKDGVGEWSIGFFEQESEIDKNGIRHIKEVCLTQYSFNPS